MNLDERKPLPGIYSADGAVLPLSELNANSLAYVGYGVAELEEILEVKINQEHYEECALIRDELLRRKVNT
ncbi:MAG: hypothetical protein JKY70_00175 [Mucilaginibacter sp.]|nr:hypothetical protein [Mucilaginibacter sp.]